MAPKRKIVIEIDDENGTINITDEEGGSNFFQSVALFAGDAQNREIMVKMFGASADAAWAFGQGYAQSRIPGAGPGIKNFYKQGVAHVCQIVDPLYFQQTVEAGELENKWECEDQSKWAKWDTEDVLEDKQESEARRKFEEMEEDDEPTIH